MPSSPAPLCIVIADDNEDQAESLARLIVLWGHDAHVCLDPHDTLESCNRFFPDVLLLDIGFPLRTDGLAVPAQVRELQLGRQVTIIATTGFDDDETQDQAKQAGFDHFLVKPLDLTRLRLLLDELHLSRKA